MAARGLRILRVAKAVGGAARLAAGQVTMRCAIGPAGFSTRKREGDGATPVGRFALSGGFFRADRLPRAASSLQLQRMQKIDGWCDAPGHASYNCPVRLPFAASREPMWREDGVYDVVIVLAHNQRPRIQNGGSAIFFHLARDGFPPTAGCIAISLADMRRLLPRLARGCRMQVGCDAGCISAQRRLPRRRTIPSA